jgi:aspartate aminotransferase-like enzyme
VSCITLPAQLSGATVAAGVAKQGYVIGAGYGALRERTIRIGHMGDHSESGLTHCLAVVRSVLESQLGR